jgi:hypothetical protein
MKMSLASLALLASAVAMTASAAPNWSGPGKPRPMFAHPPARPALQSPNGRVPGALSLPQWNGSFTNLIGHTTSFVMVGADPAVSNAATHITTYVIPVIFSYGASNGNMKFDPTVATLAGTKTVIQSLLESPLFDNGADFQSGVVDCGQAQFVDAFQRCNFWSSVSTNTGYHTILDYTKNKRLKPLKINVSAAQGMVITNPFGPGVAGIDNIDAFDIALHNYLSSHSAQITPNTFPLFVSYDIYLTDNLGQCCIGGYHTALGGQTFGYTTIVDTPGAFSEDIDAASHEIAEWMDDPFTDNFVECTDNAILEVGDPIETLPDYGTFKVKLHHYTWHPQSEAYLPYFGAPRSTSANRWYSFKHELKTFCPGPQ